MHRRVVIGRRRGGWLIAEALIGMALVGVIGMSIMAAVRSQARAEVIDARNRMALAGAQRTMDLLRMGKDVANGDADGVVIAVEREDGVAPDGWRWVCVRANCERQHVELAGLVPKGEKR
jgi:hypothetical protein